MLQTIRENKHVIEVQKPVYLDTKNQDFFELEAKHPMSKGFGFTTKSKLLGKVCKQKQNDSYVLLHYGRC